MHSKREYWGSWGSWPADGNRVLQTPRVQGSRRETTTRPFLGLRVFPGKGSESTPEPSWTLFSLKDPDGGNQAQGIRVVLRLLL